MPDNSTTLWHDKNICRAGTKHVYKSVANTAFIKIFLGVVEGSYIDKIYYNIIIKYDKSYKGLYETFLYVHIKALCCTMLHL